MITWENIATVLLFAYLLFAIRGLRLCWVFGGIGSAISTVIYFQSQLYFLTVEYLFYTLMPIYGFITWGKKDSSTAPIVQKSSRFHLRAIALLVGLALALGMIVNHYTDQSYALTDAFTTTFAFFATYLTAQKILENWLYWIVIDTALVGLHLLKGLHSFAFLYLVYTVFAILGYWSWRRMYQKQIPLG